MRPFPPDFRFGVATADHQCEAYDGHDDIRDVWEREEHLVPRGRATDFWNRYREDVDLARGMGCRAFRLSLSGARLEPSPGEWSDEAFAHYRDVLQYMRDAGMATVVTLVHNTWPLHVQAAGGGAGLLDDGFPDSVARFATEVAKRLGGLVDYYVTLNEPNQLLYGFVKLWCMHEYSMPPGLEASATSNEMIEALIRVVPNLFLAHARARRAIHAVTPKALVGANPLVLGLPRWLQRIVDHSATRLKNPEDLRGQAKHLTQSQILDSGRVDVSIAQLHVTQERLDRVLFSKPYEGEYSAAMALGSHTLLNVVNKAIRELKQERTSAGELRHVDKSVRAIQRRGTLRVGIHPGVPGLCTRSDAGGYEGLEPELARAIAAHIFGSQNAKVEFILLDGEERISATRSWIETFDGIRKSLSMFATILGTNWWNLGMAGKLAPFLCPAECVGALDFVGLDYYWGVPSLRPSQIERLLSTAQCRYSRAPVWPTVLYDILRESQERFPGKRIIVVENGSVTSADDVTRPEYLTRHIANVQHAVEDGAPVDAYLCWSITSNREWGLVFDANSDFGLYHIDLDTDPNLVRVPTTSSERYAEIIARRSANP
jgi:beta-glucosidase/6-phospho-beta-glucosidase/beta-galactosidase